MTFRANQLTEFYMMTTLPFNELTSIMNRQRITRTKKLFLAIESNSNQEGP